MSARFYPDDRHPLYKAVDVPDGRLQVVTSSTVSRSHRTQCASVVSMMLPSPGACLATPVLPTDQNSGHLQSTNKPRKRRTNKKKKKISEQHFEHLDTPYHNPRVCFGTGGTVPAFTCANVRSSRNRYLPTPRAQVNLDRFPSGTQLMYMTPVDEFFRLPYDRRLQMRRDYEAQHPQITLLGSMIV